MNDYLSVQEISLGTGLSPDQVRRAAKRDQWQRRADRTGGRGRPTFRYLLADALVSLGLAA